VGGETGIELPYTPGHENAGWVHDIGSAVTNVAVGDTMIVHPHLLWAVRAVQIRRRHALPGGSFRGIDRDGGCADLLKTSARSVVKLDQALDPKDIAALADAGVTAIHPVKKAIPVLGSGTAWSSSGRVASVTSASSA
jgi:NAD+-dependent secondary alcohol dehydrogenase Adh1